MTGKALYAGRPNRESTYGVYGVDLYFYGGLAVGHVLFGGWRDEAVNTVRGFRFLTGGGHPIVRDARPSTGASDDQSHYTTVAHRLTSGSSPFGPRHGERHPLRSRLRCAHRCDLLDSVRLDALRGRSGTRIDSPRRIGGFARLGRVRCRAGGHIRRDRRGVPRTLGEPGREGEEAGRSTFRSDG